MRKPCAMERSFSAVVVLGEPDDYISGERQALFPVAATILELRPGGARRRRKPEGLSILMTLPFEPRPVSRALANGALHET
jgi:hypothetical protein